MPDDADKSKRRAKETNHWQANMFDRRSKEKRIHQSIRAAFVDPTEGFTIKNLIYKLFRNKMHFHLHNSSYMRQIFNIKSTVRVRTKPYRHDGR